MAVAASKSSADEDVNKGSTLSVARPHHINKMQPLSGKLDELKRTLGTEVIN